jgi:hypothetical protein
VAYNRQNYIEDCLIVEKGSGNEATNAKIRKDMYERGQGDKVPLVYSNYRTRDDYEYYENLEKEIQRKQKESKPMTYIIVGIIAFVVLSYIISNWG